MVWPCYEEGEPSTNIKAVQINVFGKRAKERQKRTCVEMIKRGMKESGVNSDVSQERKEWRKGS